MAKLRCKAAPYSGSEPYIFVSYVHDDAAAVFPIIEHMVARGYRVWYDEGIHPGSNWKKVIADRLDCCTYFVAMISPRYPSSKYCMQELNLADNDDKPLLPIYLEEFRLPALLRLTLSGRQAVQYFALDDEESFYEKLFITDGLEECQGEATAEAPQAPPAAPAVAEEPKPEEPAPAPEPQETPEPSESPETPESPAPPEEPPKRDTAALMSQLAAELAARKQTVEADTTPAPAPEPDPTPAPEPAPDPEPPAPAEPNAALARVLEVLRSRGGTVTSVKTEATPIPASEPSPVQPAPAPAPEPEPDPEPPKRDTASLMERLAAELAARKKSDGGEE